MITAKNRIVSVLLDPAERHELAELQAANPELFRSDILRLAIREGLSKLRLAPPPHARIRTLRKPNAGE